MLNRDLIAWSVMMDSHTGLVKEGQGTSSKAWSGINNIEPRHEHYGCMVDSYGRSKLFKEAVELIKPCLFDLMKLFWVPCWRACKIHDGVELGELATKRVLELNLDHDGAYILLLDIYAKAGRSDDARRIRENMKFRGLSKEKGYSWLELKGTVHSFLTGDKSHPQRTEIYEKVEECHRRPGDHWVFTRYGCAFIDV